MVHEFGTTFFDACTGTRTNTTRRSTRLRRYTDTDAGRETRRERKTVRKVQRVYVTEKQVASTRESEE